jgi:MoxR-like ATPase
MSTMSVGAAEQAAEHYVTTFNRVRDEVQKYIVGQERVVEDVLIAITCGGHVLLEGVPGLGKTALVTTIARAIDLTFRRIQFTPDLLPADIVGSNILVERDGRKVFEFQRGPVFCHALLADEINRATPKTQSALLETMQERAVTVAGQTYPLDLPFFVLGTQNPIESDGTYPLPEAQLDRFFFKLHVHLPAHDEFVDILERTGGVELPQIEVVATGADILAMGQTVRQVPIDPSVRDYLIRIVRCTHPTTPEAPAVVRQFVRHGASPRAAQALLLAGRARALLAGRYHVAREDIAAATKPVIRHRIILSFEGEAEGHSVDDLIDEIVTAQAS